MKKIENLIEEKIVRISNNNGNIDIKGHGVVHLSDNGKELVLEGETTIVKKGTSKVITDISLNISEIIEGKNDVFLLMCNGINSKVGKLNERVNIILSIDYAYDQEKLKRINTLRTFSHPSDAQKKELEILEYEKLLSNIEIKETFLAERNAGNGSAGDLDFF